MEMPSSFLGDKHEISLVVVKCKYVGSCPSFNITDTCPHNVINDGVIIIIV